MAQKICVALIVIPPINNTNNTLQLNNSLNYTINNIKNNTVNNNLNYSTNNNATNYN